MTDQPKHVFISYVRENQDQVDRLCHDLESHGVNVWLDRNDIKPGARWKSAIQEAIRNGNFFIACFSDEYTSKTKTYMNEELTLATEELRQYASDREWFIPVLLSECDVPARSIGAGETLLDINWVPLYEDWNAGINRIISVIKPIPLEIQNLIFALHSEDKGIRIRAIKALGNEGDASVVPTLINALKTNDHEIYFSVVEALGRIKDKSAIPALIKELGNKELKVRDRVAHALGQIGPAALSRLLDDLKEKTPGIGQRACKALIRIGDRSTIPALIEDLKNKDYDIRRLAVYVLAEIGNDSAVPALNEALKDKNPDVRFAVAYALSKIGNTSSLPVLNEALKDEDLIFVDRVVVAISRINRKNNLFKAKADVPALIEALEDQEGSICLEDALAIVNIGPEAKASVPALADALRSNNKDVRRLAAQALGNIGPEAKASVPALIEALKGRDQWVRRYATHALKKINTPEAQKAVQEYKKKSR